jgi:hypothetical protein
MKNSLSKDRLSSATISFFILLLVCLGCSPGESGPLKPQKAENIKVVRTRMADDTAQIEKDGKIFQIYGTWGSENLQKLRIIITNNTDAEFQFDFRKVKMELASQESLLLDEAIDDTNVNVADDNPNNDNVIILSGNTSNNPNKSGDSNKSGKIASVSTLIVPPKETKTLRFYFLNSQIKENQLQAGSQVYVSILTGENPADLIQILFNCAESSFLPF